MRRYFRRSDLGRPENSSWCKIWNAPRRGQVGTPTDDALWLITRLNLRSFMRLHDFFPQEVKDRRNSTHAHRPTNLDSYALLALALAYVSSTCELRWLEVIFADPSRTLVADLEEGMAALYYALLHCPDADITYPQVKSSIFSHRSPPLPPAVPPPPPRCPVLILKLILTHSTTPAPPHTDPS